MFYYQHNDNQNGYTNTGKTYLFKQRGFFFILYSFSLGFFMFGGSGFLISFYLRTVIDYSFLLFILIEITFHMTVSQSRRFSGQAIGRFSGIIDTEINYIVTISGNEFVQRRT